MKITKGDVEHVAELARLVFSEEEKQSFTEQLNKILFYMEQLGELDTAGIQPTAHVLPLHNVFREDRVRESLTNEQVLTNAPDKEDGFFKVPKIID